MTVESTPGRPVTGRPSAPARRAPAAPPARPVGGRPGRRRSGPLLPDVRPQVRGGACPTRPTPAPPAVARRRRVAAALLVAAVLVVLAGAVLAGGGGSADAGPVGPPPSTTTLTVVGAHESLIDLARRTSPGADTASTVERIRALNGLQSSTIAAGRPLVVPAG